MTAVPPHSLEAEGAVLAAVLLDPAALDEIRDAVSPGDFYADANRRILEAVLDLDAEGSPVDAVTVAARLKDRDRLAQVGGMPYLAQLADCTPATANVASHARVVRDKARVRAMIATCQRFAAEGYGDTGDPDEWLQSAERAVFDAAERETIDRPEMLCELMPAALTDIAARKNGEGPAAGVRTGITALDDKIGTLRRSVEYVLAGRPGMGKTAIALCLATNVPKFNPGMASVFVSAEMPKDQITARLLAAESKVDVSRIERGTDLTDANWRALAAAAEVLRKLPVSIQFAPGATVADIRSIVRREIRRLRDRHGSDLQLGAIFVDYMQILNGQRDRGSSREQEIADLSKRLTWMAAEFNCAMVVLSQLNRGVETRNAKDKRPQLSDLRESGAIEQDAFGVLFAYRDEYYFPDSEHRGILELGIAKMRQGPTGRVHCRFTPEYTRIDNLETGEYDFGADDYGFDDQ